MEQQQHQHGQGDELFSGPSSNTQVVRSGNKESRTCSEFDSVGTGFCQRRYHRSTHFILAHVHGPVQIMLRR
ncbi:hypothetical protein H634G_02325 [Metarhizium anisopliae BRIP 53293]|uniref:Uncharacterized protein n=1 Tax=Metarhizium anisopliae BRIP 53293 TaxID=1291518 RepID=A0A0D9P798_METAN|nr:hypothetical protein H634G_02325 [Metarhizium anisopliae BRIP 53293]KJK95719.1 hypothetical protein H633G_00407 [Metarhizium anisopliae BRIP 53284]